MAIDVVLGLILLTAFIGLAGLVWRKLPTLVVTSPSRVRRLGQEAVKLQLVEKRAKRKLFELVAQIKQNLKTIPREHSSGGGRLADLEQSLKQKLDEHTAPERSLAELIARAEAALAAEDFTRAESSYLEALKLDAHYLPAYQGLGELYLQARDYEHAREVYEYLARRGSAAAPRLGLARVASGQGNLEEARAEYLSVLEGINAVQPRWELARILRQLGDLNGALEHLSAALKLEPANPKILDFFIELSILNGQTNQAREALDMLRSVNPDNQKISEFAHEIRQLAAKTQTKNSSRSRKLSRNT